MKVINYNPEVIEKQLVELKENIEKENNDVKKHNKKVNAICASISISTALTGFVLFVVCACNNNFVSLTSAIGMILAMISIPLGSYIASASECEMQKIENQYTLAMKYHMAVANKEVLDVLLEESDTIGFHCRINILVEGDDHIVIEKKIDIKTDFKTNINEMMLDLAENKVFIPYNQHSYRTHRQ